MVVEIRRCCECLPTDLALVRLLPRVDSPVCVQGGAGGESLLAEVAHMRPLPSVRSDVSLQQAWPVKNLAAVATGQHGLTFPDGRHIS